MPNKDLPLVDRHPLKPGGEGWLVNAQEQLVVRWIELFAETAWSTTNLLKHGEAD